MKSFCILGLSICVILTGLIPIITTAAEDYNSELIDWDQATPDLVHQRLNDSKQAGRLDQDFIKRITGATALADNMNEYDVEFYDVYIRVNDTTEILHGRVTFQIKALSELNNIDFDFYSGMAIDSVTIAGGTLSYTRNVDIVTLNLPAPVLVDEVYSFTVHYAGHPPEGGFQAFAFGYRSGKRVMSSLSEPYFARTWWPCKDRMTDKPDSMDIAIEVDTTFYCGSNGTLDSTMAGGSNSHIFYYNVRYPIVTYLFSVAISVYTVWEDVYTYNGGASTMPIVHAVYPDRYDYSLTKYNIIPSAIDILSDRFGPYPFLNEKYGHANFEWGGGMEHQTMTSMTGSNFGFYAPVVVHELAHQWWGDMITCASWQDIWLNEGWASYAEALYYEATGGMANYHSYMAGMNYTGGGTIYVSDTTSVSRIFNGGLSYDKGAWVCHMLRGVLGDELFFEGVAAYYNSEFKHGAATTEDFKNVFEASSGVELDYFFDEWIHGTYRPSYQYAWTTEPAGNGTYDCYLLIEQTQSTTPQVFHMPIQFFFDMTLGSDDTLVFVSDARRKMIKINLPFNVNSITLDPSDWILKYAVNDNWGVRILAVDSDLSEAYTAQMYIDTIVVLGGSSNYEFSTVNGTSLPAGMSVNSQGVLSGTPVSIGEFTFMMQVIDLSSGASDEVELTLVVSQCCGLNENGYSGNTNCDLEGKRNLADITRLIDRIYISKIGLCCESSGNTDGDFGFKVNLSDIARLIDHVYISQTETAPCI